MSNFAIDADVPVLTPFEVDAINAGHVRLAPEVKSIVLVQSGDGRWFALTSDQPIFTGKLLAEYGDVEAMMDGLADLVLPAPQIEEQTDGE